MNSYFAASNSAFGFKNYYRECFSQLDRLYIIKGGPGTGKSGSMKHICAFAESKGYDTERFYCSSDQGSLDGIIIYKSNESIGFIDGTSPHEYSVHVAGAVDNIINLGAHWDSNMLMRQKEDILKLTRQKREGYDNVYRYLAACGNLAHVIMSYTFECIDKDRMSEYAEHLLKGTDTGEGYIERIRLTDSVGMRGRVRLSSYEYMADKVYIICGRYGIGKHLLSTLICALRAKARRVMISYDPVCPDMADAVFDIDAGVAYVLSDKRMDDDILKGKTVRRIHMGKYISNDKLDRLISDIRYAYDLYCKCMDGAVYSFADVEKAHFALEGIYGRAMDFSAVDREIGKYCALI